MDKIFSQKKQKKLSVEDVFSTYVYTGNGSTQTINNGIDLADEGGLVWTKNRVNNHYQHELVDTERGGNSKLYTSLTADAEIMAGVGMVFNPDGYIREGHNSLNGEDFVSWTFRKAPKFFDIVKYTGDGVAGREISHNLGCEVGMMIVKKTSISGDNWIIYHRNEGGNKAAYFSSIQFISDHGWWKNTSPTDSVFTLGSSNSVNQSGQEHIAYLFAHDESEESMIKCGSFTGATSVDLGFEPQYILYKRADNTGDWVVLDNIRGIVTGGADKELYPNLITEETDSTSDHITLTPTGFDTANLTGDYVYMAIRRPMPTPTSSSEVFAIDTRTSGNPNFTSNFTVDFALRGDVDTTGGDIEADTRLLGTKYIYPSSSASAAVDNSIEFDFMDGYLVNQSTYSSYYSWMWRRAKGFFDVVCYTGDLTLGRTVTHNLGVVPEMVWLKSITGGHTWCVHHTVMDMHKFMSLNTDAAKTTYYVWYSLPTDTSLTLRGTTATNGAGSTHIAYLFASLPGISKVGSYTGNGTNQAIDCEFSTGTKFLIIKRTDAIGDWYMYDSVRGIITGNDPFLKLDTTDAQVTTDDSIDPHNSGFIVNQTSTTNLNINGGSYIYYAISN